MAAKVDEAEQTNTIDPARLKKEIGRVEDAIAAKESHRMGYVESCKPFNERISNAYEIASKTSGISVKILKAKVKEREFLRKIKRISDDMEEDARDTFEMVSQALGDFGDLPLGAAAKERAAKSDAAAEAVPPRKPRGRPRKAPSAAAADAPADPAAGAANDDSAEDEDTAGLDPIAVAETSDPTYIRGYNAAMAGAGCSIPSELCGLYRDRFHAGWLAGDRQRRAGEATAAQNASRLADGISPLPH